MTGDGFQNGGTLVVDKGGKVLLCFKQENAPDHVDNTDVLKALGLESDGSGAEGGAKGDSRQAESGSGQAEGGSGQAEGGKKPENVVCEDDVCKRV